MLHYGRRRAFRSSLDAPRSLPPLSKPNYKFWSGCFDATTMAAWPAFRMETNSACLPAHHHSAIQIDQAAWECAYQEALSIFADCDIRPPGVNSHVSIKICGDHNVGLDIRRDIVPPLAFAQRYFGGTLPDVVIKKLRNWTQTQDTLFELLCLGVFSQRHKVTYEPKIISGKVLDLLVEPTNAPPVYVECKSQHFSEAKYFHSFQEVSARISSLFDGLPVTTAAMTEGLRIEVSLNTRPSDREIEGLRRS